MRPKASQLFIRLNEASQGNSDKEAQSSLNTIEIGTLMEEFSFKKQYECVEYDVDSATMFSFRNTPEIKKVTYRTIKPKEAPF